MAHVTLQDRLDYQYSAVLLVALKRLAAGRLIAIVPEVESLHDAILELADSGDGITEEWVEPKTRATHWTTTTASAGQEVA